jgi:hypothetical protein
MEEEQNDVARRCATQVALFGTLWAVLDGNCW